MTTSTKRTTRNTAPAIAHGAENAATLRDELAERIAENRQYIAALNEADRLKVELMTAQSKLDQELAAASDVDNLVEKIESGEQLESSDTAVQIAVLKDHVKAFTIAHNRAESRRREILKDISSDVAAPLAAQHREKCQAILDTMQELCNMVDELPKLPRLLKSVGLDPGNDFPMFHWSELQEVTPKLNHFTHNYKMFLNVR